MASPTLQQVIGSLRRRLFVVVGAADMLWALAAGGACLLAAAWLDLALEFSATARIVATVASLSAALLLAGVALWRTVRRSVPAFLARRLDEAAGTGGQVLSGLDMLQPVSLPAGAAGYATLSAGLAELTVRRAAEIAAVVPRSRAVPARPVRRPAASLACLLALTAVIVLTMPRLASTQWLRFTDPFGDHPPYAAITFEVEPPGARVLYGDGLEISALVVGPAVDGVELVLDAPHGSKQGDAVEVLPMFPEPGGRWRAALANFKQEHSYYVRSGRARSHRYEIRLITVPKIERVRFRVAPPDYTRQSVYEGDLPQGGLSGLPGAHVQVWAKSNRPLSGGAGAYVSADKRSKLVLTPGKDDPSEASGSFVIDRSGRMDLRVRDTDGQASQEVYSAPITLLADERPFVRLVEPRPESFATPTARIPVVLSAEDDYGISRLELFRSLNASRYLPLIVPIPAPPPARANEVVDLPLAEYGLEPGDEIKLFARVEDTDPAGAKGAESTVAVIKIISQEQFERMLRSRDGLSLLVSKYQQAQRRTEALAEAMESLRKKLAAEPEGSPVAEALQRELQELARRLQQEAESLRKLAESRLPYDLDRELAPHLDKQAKALERLAERLEALNGKAGLTSRAAAEELEALARQLAGDRKRLASDLSPPLEWLAAIFPLLRDESRFVELYQRQRELAERLASLDGHDQEDDPALKSRMRELEVEQRKIRADLADLLADIEEHAERLPDDLRTKKLRKSALEFATAVRESGAGEAMAAAETGLAEFSGTRGHAEAKEAADILEKFLSKCQGLGCKGEGGMCLKSRFQPGMGNCLGRTAEQLLADLGFGQGSSPGGGMGVGAGGGYSARQSTLNNVGMYGGLPQVDASSGQGSGESQQLQAGQEGRGAGGRPNSATRDASPGARDDAQASGTGEAAVPLEYRRKVGRYFQRIADELGSESE